MESAIQSERFILVDQNWTYGQLFQKIALKLGVEPPSKQLSYSSLEMFWRLDWLRSNVLGKRRRLSKNMAKGLYYHEIYDNSKLKETLGFQYEDLDRAIDFCCNKFKVP